MTAIPAAGDPAFHLWQRCAPQELAQIAPNFVTPPVPVGKIASDLGIKVISRTMEPNISGLIRFNVDSYQIEVNNTDAGVRQRFTVCHEIAHYLLHKEFIGTDGIQDSILFRSKLTTKQEVEANQLGAAILLPWNLVNSWHMETFNTPPEKQNIEAIARHFRASLLAVGFRLKI